MQAIKKTILFSLLILILFFFLLPDLICFADSLKEDVYIVLDEESNVLFERNEVYVGDEYISKEFVKYEIIDVDHKTKICHAKYVEQIPRPNVNIYYGPRRIGNINKKIGIYLTHNDESYITGDGYDSVYGVGGIHDVAKKIKLTLEKNGVNIFLNETLHIPHDAYAYSRSKSTASDLLKNNIDAIFDIHRDGASRASYIAKSNGKEKCMVRMVVGLGNSNHDANLEFATYIKAVADEMYPWLIKDIYLGKGHYNQNLYGKALLFEMGSYLVEKKLVLESVEPLCDVVCTVLYQTTVNQTNGDITVNGSENSNEVLINNVEELNKKEKNSTVLEAVLIVSGAIALIIIAFVMNYYIENKVSKED